MNLKKFISGVSALTIAASAFAGLAVTASASETTTSYDFEDGKALFANDSRITVAIEDNADLSSKVVGFTCASNAQNGYSFSHYDFSSLVSGATETKVEFDYYNTSGGRAIVTLGDASVRGTTGGSSKTTYSNTGAIFALGSDKNNSLLNGATSALTDYTNKWMHVSVDVDEIAKKYSYTITSGNTTLAEKDDQSFYSSGAGSLTQIDLFGYINNSHCAMIDNLSITKIVDESTESADYTIKHVGPNGEKVKDDQTKSGIVGSSIVLTDTDKANISGQYYYESDDSADKTITADGTAVVTVTYREPIPYDATVTAKNGEDTIKTFTGTSVDTSASVRIYYTKYISDSGKYYVTNANSSYPSYAKTFSSAANTDVAYSEAEKVLFASEVEDLTPSHSWAANGSTPDRYSNGGARRLYTNSYVTVWKADKEAKVTISLWSRNQSSKNSEGINVYLMNSDREIAESPVVKLGDWAAAANSEMTSTEFTVPAGSTIIIYNDTEYNSNLEMDYVAVKGEYVAPKEVDGVVDVAETFSGDKYDGEATALTATFDITGATVNTVTVTPDGEQVAGEAQSQAIPATSETTLVYGIVVNKIVDKNAFTAKATFVE
jgi:hypothetical protein